MALELHDVLEPTSVGSKEIDASCAFRVFYFRQIGTALSHASVEMER
jgi:hypothetical protein